MIDNQVSRRAAMVGAGVAAVWLASPARALFGAAGTLPVPPLVDLLLAKMTLEEKAGQLTLMAAAWGGGAATALNPASNNPGFQAQIADAVDGKLTGVFNGNGAVMASQMQHAVMSGSRLKIPLLFGADVIHGYRTIFPVPVAEAATFEPELSTHTARVAAFEAAGAGIDWTFFPMVDIARDQRWGRTMEGAGEDVLLGTLFAAARVRGFQGDSLSANDSMMACVKHFAAYGAVEAGLDYNSVDLSMRTLLGTYLPPYKAAIDAGAMSVMASFNEIDGVPSTGNHWLMTDLLRGTWGFDGFVVSDYTGDQEMIAAGFAKDGRDAARIAFMAGVDMSMESGLYYQYLPGLVRDGTVPQAALDRSVRRVLAVKALLGLFDDPFRRIDVKREKARSRLPANLALAREAARKAIVMLKNDGDLLPLPRSGKRIALIGPFAGGQESLDGPWVVYGDNQQSVDLATGVHAAFGDRAAISVTPGSDVEKAVPGGIEAAVAAANAADVVVLAIGESEGMSGEAQSRTEIVVPAPQQALAEAVATTGKPVVVVLQNGRGLALQGAVRDARAILVTWFLGSESGHAIADILFGAAGPSGRLPISFPFDSGQEPYHYDHKITGRPAPPGPRQPYKTQYRTAPDAALFPFGHGLTYGRIDYTDLQLSSPTLPWSGKIDVSARLTNSGTREAVEVAQLYIHDQVASITRPIRQLKAFQKKTLAPGASATVRFTLTRADLEFLGLDLKPTVEPGTFDVWIAPSAQADGAHSTFDLVAG
jgi:beta-glucosidase